MSIDNPVLPFPAEAPTADPFSAEYPATSGAAPGAEWYEPETPFLDTRYNESPRVDTSSAPGATETTFETPFATEYYGQPGPADREAVQFHNVLTELDESPIVRHLRAGGPSPPQPDNVVCPGDCRPSASARIRGTPGRVVPYRTAPLRHSPYAACRRPPLRSGGRGSAGGGRPANHARSGPPGATRHRGEPPGHGAVAYPTSI